jgi:cytochrome b561
MRPNGSAQYGSLARFFHWAVALLVVATVPLAWAMLNLRSGPTQDLLFTIHQSIGLTIFALVVLRLAWRSANPPPPLPASVSPVQARLARLNHWLLYLVLVLMPVTGYLSVTAGGYPLSFFGLFDVPRLVAKGKSLAHLTEATHLALQYVIYALVVLHVAAALHHRWVKHDGVLRRMWPGRAAAPAE